MARIVPAALRTMDLLDEALDLIGDHFRDRTAPLVETDENLNSLLDRALERSLNTPRGEPVRLLRHFACTGGTLISRALAAQPNTVILSEIDPFNAHYRDHQEQHFSPTDTIRLADSGLNPLADEVKGQMFAAAMRVLHENASQNGQRIILREHCHGRFCTDRDWNSVRSIPDLLMQTEFETKTLVTVRHPLDSWLSLVENGWHHFRPFTLDEYSRRYHAFLDECGNVAFVKYEDFVEAPDAAMARFGEILNLPINEAWQALLPVIRMSGDSGRKGAAIASRERRAVPNETTQEAAESQLYTELCQRLNYDPSTAELG